MDEMLTASVAETLPSSPQNSISLQALFCDMDHKVDTQSISAFPTGIFPYLT